LEILVSNIKLGFFDQEGEIIRKDLRCQDIVRRTNEIYGKYIRGCEQFEGMAIAEEGSKTNFKFEFEQNIRNIYIDEKLSFGNTIKIMQLIRFLPYRADNCMWTS
jgi:hypothetical protein